MKRLVRLKKIAVTTLALTALLATGVFAQEDIKVAESEAIDTVEDDIDINDFYLKEGLISSIEKNEGYYSIVLVDDIENPEAVMDMGIILNIQEGTLILDQKDGSLKTFEDLKKGMEISVVIDSYAPQTMSIPPMTSGGVAVVINSEEAGFIKVSEFGDELVSEDNTLALNIDENVKIIDNKGTKKEFSSEDIKDSNAMVFYSTSTRSIPAQTNPSLVVILEKNELNDDDDSDDNVIANTIKIREVAERNGFEIKWKSNDEPVLLTKDDVVIEIKVDNKICSINGVKTELELAPELINGTITVSEEVEDILKKY